MSVRLKELGRIFGISELEQICRRKLMNSTRFVFSVFSCQLDQLGLVASAGDKKMPLLVLPNRARC